MTAATIDRTPHHLLWHWALHYRLVNTWPGQWRKNAPQVCSLSPLAEVVKFPCHCPSQAVRPPAWHCSPCAPPPTYPRSFRHASPAAGGGGDHLMAPQNQGWKEWCFEEGKFQSYTHKSLRLLIQLKRKQRNLKDTGLANSSIFHNCNLCRLRPRQGERYSS